MEDNRDIQIYDKPVDTVSYVKYSDFFDDAFDTQIIVKDTNDKIMENYSAYFDSPADSASYNFVYTDCVTACNADIIKKYYDEKKNILTPDANYTEMDSALCKKLNASEGFYITGTHYATGQDIQLCFIRNTTCFIVEVSDADIQDEQLLKKLSEL